MILICLTFFYSDLFHPLATKSLNFSNSSLVFSTLPASSLMLCSSLSAASLFMRSSSNCFLRASIAAVLLVEKLDRAELMPDILDLAEPATRAKGVGLETAAADLLASLRLFVPHLGSDSTWPTS